MALIGLIGLIGSTGLFTLTQVAGWPGGRRRRAALPGTKPQAPGPILLQIKKSGPA